MSRIDEALRRAGDGRSAAVLPAPQSPFASPWTDTKAEADVVSLWPAPQAQEAPETVEPEGSILAVASGEMLPALNLAWGERLAMSPQSDRALVEQFRRLAATLHKAQAANGLRIVMVTSAVPSDGKTLTAINLALVLSGSYKRRVLLVDADLRRPSIGEMTGLGGLPGLSEALKAKKDQTLALVPLTPMLSLLPSGRPDPDPIGGLTSPRMARILKEASERFDWVIIDSPPVEPLADANLLAEMVDGTLFVVRAGTTQCPVVQRALEALGPDRVLGVVLNGVAESENSNYGHYYYGAGSATTAGE